jgi:F0F1-type ATP synthase alpha subunit
MKLSISLTSTVIVTISSFEYSFPEQTESQFSKVENIREMIAQPQGKSLSVEAKAMFNEQLNVAVFLLLSRYLHR